MTNFRASARATAMAIGCATVLNGGIAAAQGAAAGRLAIEAVAAVNTSSRAVDDPFVFLDLAATVRIGGGLDVVIRPYARRLPESNGGGWDGQLYQAQIRYQPTGGIRLDAGIISSPIGIGTFELRQDLNPVVGSPFYYFGTLPPFDSRADNRLTVLTGGYPLGAVLSLSGNWWDARAGVTDGTPARYRKIFETNGPAATAQLVAGAGITPTPGLRLGIGFANGKYRRASDTDYYADVSPPQPDAGARVVNLEAEYAFRYTRLSGEWVWDRFDSETTPAIARGMYVQAVQTLTPRVFAASRFTHLSTPRLVAGNRVRATRSTGEISAGYRLTPEVTLKGGVEISRRLGADAWTRAALGSVVWAKRWF